LSLFFTFAELDAEPWQEVSMIGNGWLQIAIFGAIVVAITKPFGFYMTRVFVGAVTSGLNTMLPYDAPYGVPVGLARTPAALQPATVRARPSRTRCCTKGDGHAESQVRTRLLPGGRWIRTNGPP
jgi:hypothetical protein